YYNAFVGGTGGAGGRFETDYWAASYREAAFWLRDHRVGPQTRVLVAASPYALDCLRAYLAPEQFQVARTMDLAVPGALPPAFDYYVATTRYGLDRNFPQSPVAHVIGRDGARFTVIRKR
ncbi:MAG: hypothetical protein ABI837_16505, partial [Acidobacteriota bacterium]